MNKELKVFKSGNGQAISLKKKAMEDMGLEIGDTLVYSKYEDGIVITKKTEKNFEERWNEFFENGGSYHDKESYDWGEPRGREIW
ncbi:AbrB/MazE/SpoVT family DNA-binding domain-containing protein [Salinicoccus kekensis]|uniref:Antitoxin MazE n=1 Tax=Salinicoccus kekensis TaxID=714307 RepID=A0A285UH22_9STAP|nr:AbrB/MazE/SpoVT family DNA-binding domain-containing protein [Salinicoccus kekensis]SOC41159.1 antitoxin MazE [Salinicoccus kekensis]